jgi:hypothetical protein
LISWVKLQAGVLERLGEWGENTRDKLTAKKVLNISIVLLMINGLSLSLSND